VIADGTAEVSEEWKRIAAISENALGKILDISESINMVMVNFSQSQRLDGTQEQSREGLESLRRAAAFAVAQGNKIEIAIEAIRTRSAEVGNITDLLEACFSRIDDVINYLQKTKKQLEIDCPDVREACASAEVEMLFSKSYTTQMERDVLHAALYGTPLAVAQECSTGNDVELF
jgi:arsenate reductase-like glutaredoxin family protein